MYFKSIFQGKLQFGNLRSFQKVIQMFNHRIENYYKTDILFKSEEIFHEKDLSMVIPRTVQNISNKNWKNTTNLVEYVSQFAVAGAVGAWMLDNGKITKYAWIEPQGDKAVVQAYKRGIDLLGEQGKEQEAKKVLSEVIEMYNKHSQAYERRGFVNYRLQKFHDAERDFTKAINADGENSLALHGRARLKMKREDWAEAIEDLDRAIKTSLALQDIHWSSRRLKAECHIQLEQFDKAEFELRFFTRRKFVPDSVNKDHLRKAFFDFGRVLLELGKHKDALEAFNKAIEMPDGIDSISEADKFLYRGIARKNCGKNGYIADWNQASKLGSKRAGKLLEEMA